MARIIRRRRTILVTTTPTAVSSILFLNIIVMAVVIKLSSPFKMALPPPLRTTPSWVLNQNPTILFRRRQRVLAFSSTRATIRSNSEQQQPPSSNGTVSSNKQTQYTISCPPTDPELLDNLVKKHVHTLDKFCNSRPIALHTLQAYNELLNESSCLLSSSSSSSEDKKELVLDSGCGTGRSSLYLGSLYPNRIIIGVDKSIVRLEKNERFFQQQQHSGGGGNKNDKASSNNSTTNTNSSTNNVQQVKDNVWLVRANLIDFWRCCLQDNLTFVEHYLLYPNPYPKKSRLRHRFYAHPAFPLLLRMSGSGGRLVLRSNWHQYLVEFASSIISVDEALSSQQQQQQQQQSTSSTNTNYSVRHFVPAAKRGPTLRVVPKNNNNNNNNTAAAWTNFEEKYNQVGEPIYELVL